jgi:hypothetical protein
LAFLQSTFFTVTILTVTILTADIFTVCIFTVDIFTVGTLIVGVLVHCSFSPFQDAPGLQKSFIELGGLAVLRELVDQCLAENVFAYPKELLPIAVQIYRSVTVHQVGQCLRGRKFYTQIFHPILGQNFIT